MGNVCSNNEKTFKNEDEIEPKEIDLDAIIEEELLKPTAMIASKPLAKFTKESIKVPQGMSSKIRYLYYTLVEGFTLQAEKNLILINRDTLRVYSITGSSSNPSNRIKLESESKLSERMERFLNNNFRDWRIEERRQHLEYSFIFDRRRMTLYFHPELGADATVFFKLKEDNGEIVSDSILFEFEDRLDGVDKGDIKDYQLIESTNLDDGKEVVLAVLSQSGSLDVITQRRLMAKGVDDHGPRPSACTMQLFSLKNIENEGKKLNSLISLDFGDINFRQNLKKLLSREICQESKFKLIDLENRQSVLIYDLKTVLVFYFVDMKSRTMTDRAMIDIREMISTISVELERKFDAYRKSSRYFDSFKVKVESSLVRAKYFPKTNSVVLSFYFRNFAFLMVNIKNLLGKLKDPNIVIVKLKLNL